MRTTLDFEKAETKKILSELDFEYFMSLNIEKEKYSQKEIDLIYNSFKETSKHIDLISKKNKNQFYYYSVGQVRKMFTGGFLPALFELDESREHIFNDFSNIGESWAYFNYWKKYQKRKLTKEKIWNLTIKVGSILAIILSLIKLFEYIN